MSDDLMDATAWFDQFPPLVEGAPWNTEGHWCPRHWAPCPILAANGITASLELMRIFIEEMVPPNIRSPAALNRAVQAIGYLCCTLGDERMYDLWGKCPPA